MRGSFFDRAEAMTIENIYHILWTFDGLYDIINDEEKRNLIDRLNQIGGYLSDRGKAEDAAKGNRIQLSYIQRRQCSSDKENMIVEALKHFKMIL